MATIEVDTANLKVLGQGLVFMKGALSKEMQIFLANYALEAGIYIPSSPLSLSALP